MVRPIIEIEFLKCGIIIRVLSDDITAYIADTSRLS